MLSGRYLGHRNRSLREITGIVKSHHRAIMPDIRTCNKNPLTITNGIICLISKWGFDGSSGHSSYMQAFYDSGADDSAVFITCLVPVRIVSGDIVIWQNPRPASTKYCRPIKIEFVKESTQVSVAESKK